MRQYPSHRAQRQNWEGLEQRRPPHHLRRKQLARSRIDRRGSFRAVRAFVWDSRPLRPGTIHVVWTTLDDAGRPTCSTIWAPLSRKRAETKVGLDSGPVLRCSLRLRQGDSKARRLVSSTTRGTRRVRTGALAAPAVIARFHDSVLRRPMPSRRPSPRPRLPSSIEQCSGRLEWRSPREVTHDRSHT